MSYFSILGDTPASPVLETATPISMATGEMLQPLTAGMNHLSLSGKTKPTYQVCFR